MSHSPAILAIDTSGEHGSLAILAGASLSEVALYAPDGGHSSALYGNIAALLARAGLKLDDIDCFAAAAGPGSFTGVRVALAAAKGLAAALDKPMVAVSNLAALAALGGAALRAPVADARRGQVFGAVYTADGSLAVPETVADPRSFLALLPERGDLEIVVAEAGLLPPGLTAGRPVLTVAPEQLARAVARLATRQYLAGLAVDPAGVDANYVRRSDAELNWTDTR